MVEVEDDQNKKSLEAHKKAATKFTKIVREPMEDHRGATKGLPKIRQLQNYLNGYQLFGRYVNTLFDENAASHIALGQCYSKCFKDGENLSKDEIISKGGNSSMIHIDWMIGSGEINVDGLTADETTVPVFRNGEWAG